jgi:hypothetical protein
MRTSTGAPPPPMSKARPQSRAEQLLTRATRRCSRQLAVYGRESMRRLAGARVLVVGMNGLGVEVGACARGRREEPPCRGGGGLLRRSGGPGRRADCLTTPRAVSIGGTAAARRRAGLDRRGASPC